MLNQKEVLFLKNGQINLKQYLIDGYTINKKRIKFLEKQINVIEIASRFDQKIISDEGKHDITNNCKL